MPLELAIINANTFSVLLDTNFQLYKIQFATENVYIVYSPLFYIQPFRPICQRANLRLGDFYCLHLSLFKETMYG